MLTCPFFNTSLLEKPDFSLKKATKVKDHEASKSQRSKKISLRKFFLFDFWSNWTILSHLAKVFLVFHGRDCKGLFLTWGRGVWSMMTSAKKDIWLQSQQMHKQEYILNLWICIWNIDRLEQSVRNKIFELLGVIHKLCSHFCRIL